LMLSVVLSALIVSAFAGTYVVPELPCEWTLIWNVSNAQYSWYSVQQVNGRFMRLERVTAVSTDPVEIVLRSDLDDSLIKKFIVSSGSRSESSVTYDSVSHYYRPVDFNDQPYDTVVYSSKKCGMYYGKECTIYHHVDAQDYDLYVDSNGLPIGRVTSSSVTNFTWLWKADLSLFVFPQSISFSDDRIHTPPDESICQQGTSSAEGQSSSGCTHKTCIDGEWKQTTNAEMKSWEEQSTECELFTCDCGTGFVHFNRKYISTGESDVCVNDRCGTVETFVGSGAVVIITIDADFTRDDVDLDELKKFISNETGIEEDTIILALNVNESEYVIQVAVFLEGVQDAEVVAQFASDLGKSNCTASILCKTESTRILVGQLESGVRDSSICIFVLLFMLVSLFNLMK